MNKSELPGYQRALGEEHHTTKVGESNLTSLYHAQDEFQWRLRLRDRALGGCVRVLGLSYHNLFDGGIFDTIVRRDGAALQLLHVAKDQVAKKYAAK